jgi:hypothetical protein
MLTERKSEDAVKSEPSSSKIKTKVKATVKKEENDTEESRIVKEEEISSIKKEDPDDAKTVDENPMSNEELDAQLDAMGDSNEAVEAETEDGA